MRFYHFLHCEKAHGQKAQKYKKVGFEKIIEVGLISIPYSFSMQDFLRVVSGLNLCIIEIKCFNLRPSTALWLYPFQRYIKKHPLMNDAPENDIVMNE